MTGPSKTNLALSATLVFGALGFIGYLAKTHQLNNPYATTILVVLLVFACAFGHVTIPSMFRGKGANGANQVSERIAERLRQTASKLEDAGHDDKGQSSDRSDRSDRRRIHRHLAGPSDRRPPARIGSTDQRPCDLQRRATGIRRWCLGV